MKNGKLLLFGLQLENEGWYRDGPGEQTPLGRKVAVGPFWQYFACPKLGDAGKTRVTSKTRAVTILTLEQNPPERIFLYIFWTSSQEDFARKSKFKKLTSGGRTSALQTLYPPLPWVMGIFGEFWGREPDLYCKFSDFQNLSVFGNFSLWNHIVCHRYRWEKVHNTFINALNHFENRISIGINFLQHLRHALLYSGWESGDPYLYFDISCHRAMVSTFWDFPQFSSDPFTLGRKTLKFLASPKTSHHVIIGM